MIRDSSVSVVRYRTILAMDFFGWKMPCTINRNKYIPIDTTKRVEISVFLKYFKYSIENWKKPLRVDIIENISNVVIAGYLFDFKKSFCITLPLRFLHCSLISQKRWTLNEKHRKSTQNNIFYGVCQILSSTFVRKALDSQSKWFYDLIENCLHRPVYLRGFMRYIFKIMLYKCICFTGRSTQFFKMRIAGYHRTRGFRF